MPSKKKIKEIQKRTGAEIVNTDTGDWRQEMRNAGESSPAFPRQIMRIFDATPENLALLDSRADAFKELTVISDGGKIGITGDEDKVIEASKILS